MTGILVSFMAGYLVGALPIGLAIGRLYGQDLREVGSGRTGTTNVLRTLGFRAAALVFLSDFAKGALPVLSASLVFSASSAEVAAAMGAVIGHNWPVFSQFRGGRGVAPALGTVSILVPWVAVSAFALFLVVVWASRYVSLGSVIGVTAAGVALVALALVGIQPWDYGAYGVLGAAIIVVQHRDNIQRLIKGNERRLGEGA